MMLEYNFSAGYHFTEHQESITNFYVISFLYSDSWCVTSSRR